MTSRKNRMFVFSVCLAVAAALAAVFFSSQPSQDSNGLSKGILYQIMECLQIEITYESVKMGNFLIRKMAHFTLYFILGLGLTGAFQFQKKVYSWIPALLLGVIFAASDEFHQVFTGRTAMVRDVVLDSIGVVTGCLVANYLWKWINKGN